MSRPPRPLFLERRSYRHRRLMDAARLLPVLGVLLFLVPLLFAPDAEGRTDTSSVTIYVFCIWAALIVAAALIATRLSRHGQDSPDARGRERTE